MDARGARAVLDGVGRFMGRSTDCFGRRVQRTSASQDGLFHDSERNSRRAMHGWLSEPIYCQALQVERQIVIDTGLQIAFCCHIRVRT